MPSRASHLDKSGRAGWRLISYGNLSYLIGELIWFGHELQGLDSFPSVADPFHLAYLPLTFAGILQFSRPFANPIEGWLVWTDVTIVAISALLLVWYFLLSAIADPQEIGGLRLSLSLAYPVGDTLLSIALAAWVLRPRQATSPWPRRWLLAGLGAFLGADLIFSWQEAQESYAVGGISDGFDHLGSLMMMTAAYLAAQPQEQRAIYRPPPPWSWTLAILPYLAIAAVYALLIASAFGWMPAHLSKLGQEPLFLALVLSGSCLTLLSMIRQAIASREAERLRSEHTLAQQERRFAALARYTSDLILLLDAELRPQFVSQSFARIFGWTPLASTKISLFELIHPNDRERAAKMLARAFLSPEIPLLASWRMRHADGSWRDIELLLTNLTSNPAVRGLILNGRDITERQRYERALMLARDAAESANRAKDRFLANMSHEIRTPLQAITGLTELLLASSLTPHQRDYPERIQLASHSLLGLLNDILDYSKIAAGRMVLESTPFRLSSVLERTHALFEIQAERKGSSLQMTLSPDLPDWLKGDPLRLSQILNDLVGNAVKFTQQGGIWIEADCLAQTPEAVHLEFRVCDTGPGIPEALQKQLFNPFYQEDASTSRRYGGSGLGLSICKGLVEIMGGEIGVKSTPGQGSTFWFRVSLERAAEASAPQNLGTQSPPAMAQDPSLATRVAQDIPQPAGVLPPDPSGLLQRLRQLNELLESQSGHARALSRLLADELQGTPWQAAYEPIAQAIAVLDFESARQQLGRFLSSRIAGDQR